MRPLVLLSNDDGYLASGLSALRQALLRFADVVVCAPETNQSATSHSLTLQRVLRLRQVEEGIFVIDGTPADCVYVALHSGERVLPRPIDLCVSGMNHGLNLGHDVFYSGTVAAAREAALRGIPALAVSADTQADPERAAEAAAQICQEALTLSRKLEQKNLLLNVNVPPGSQWQTRATCLGRRTYEGDVIFRTDPRGGEYLWIGGANVSHQKAAGSDTEAYDEGAIGITPLSLDLSDLRRSDVAKLVADAVRA